MGGSGLSGGSGARHWLLRDQRGRLANRVQVTTDGLACTLQAAAPVRVDEDVGYAAVVKLYGDPDHAVHVGSRTRSTSTPATSSCKPSGRATDGLGSHRTC